MGEPGDAFCCEACGSVPMWRLDRRGDAVVSWACAEHLSAVMDGLQRDWEITEVVVRHSPKLHEWAELGRRLDEVDS